MGNYHARFEGGLRGKVSIEITRPFAYPVKDDRKDTEERQPIMSSLMDKARAALEDAGMVGPLDHEG